MIIVTKNYLLYIRKIENKISIRHRINVWENFFLLLCEIEKKNRKSCALIFFKDSLKSY